MTDPIIIDLHKRYPKSGPNPQKDESMDDWARRYLEYVRKKYNLEK